MQKGLTERVGTNMGVEHLLHYAQEPMDLGEESHQDSEDPYFGPISGKSFYVMDDGKKIPAEIALEYSCLLSGRPATGATQEKPKSAPVEDTDFGARVPFWHQRHQIPGPRRRR